MGEGQGVSQWASANREYIDIDRAIDIFVRQMSPGYHHFIVRTKEN